MRVEDIFNIDMAVCEAQTTIHWSSLWFDNFRTSKYVLKLNQSPITSSHSLTCHVFVTDFYKSVSRASMTQTDDTRTDPDLHKIFFSRDEIMTKILLFNKKTNLSYIFLVKMQNNRDYLSVRTSPVHW